MHKNESLEAVLAERARQDSKWGQQDHEPVIWITILAEEFGETAQAALEVKFNEPSREKEDHLRLEAIQTAAVALAFVEYLDRHRKSQ